MIHPYYMDYSVADQKKKMYLYVLAQEDLQGLVLYEKTQLQNRAYNMIPFL